MGLGKAELALPGLGTPGHRGHIGMGERVFIRTFLAGLALCQFCPTWF